MKKYLITALFVLNLFAATAQSPWVVPKKGYYLQFSYNTIPEYKLLFNGSNDDFQTSRNIRDKTVQLYGEYGMTDKFTLTFSVPFKILQSGDLNPGFEKLDAEIPQPRKVNALGNIQLSTKYKLLDKKWVAAGQFRLELPADVSAGNESGLYTGYDAWSFSPIISVGRGWTKFYGFYWLSAIFRTNNYSDYFNSGIEGGWKPLKNGWIIGYAELLHSFQNGSRALPPPEKQFGLYSNNLEYFSYGLKLLYETNVLSDKKLGFIAHAAGSFSGFAVAKSPLLSVGIYLKK
jgi:hypothetical protein